MGNWFGWRAAGVDLIARHPFNAPFLAYIIKKVLFRNYVNMARHIGDVLRQRI